MTPSTQRVIRTPDQRLRVFVSSTLQELAAERRAARQAIEQLHLAPVMFELGARPHPPKDLYRTYLDQSHIFIGIYWQKYGWVAPDMDISGLEDEYNLSGAKPKLIYIKTPAPDREPRLKALLDRIKNDGVSYKYISTAEELCESIESDLAMLLTESFETTQVAGTAPLETAVRHRHNLPTPLTRLIGRETELRVIHDLLLQADVSLVTLTGPGGTGKSRLGLEAANEARDHFEDGVFMIALGAIRQTDLVASAMAAALDVREIAGDQSIVERLKNQLRDKHVLLLLDNFEQVIDAASLVADLLRVCSRLTVLVTSRTPLHLRGERELLVAPLALPDRRHAVEVEQLAQYAAIELFVQRALDVKPGFVLTADTAPIIAEICHRLDGLPLAIELAAARIKLLTPQTLLARLEHGLDVLKSGARDLPERQQALRNTIAWSYDLLDPSGKILFRRLAVFVGGWILDAVEAVCNADGALGSDVLDELESLVDNSLLQSVLIGHDLRFNLLETIREYARERLIDSSEEEFVRQHHADYYLALAESAAPQLRRADQVQWFDRLETEHDNLRAARDWFDTQPDRREDNLRLAVALSWFWFVRGHWSEGRQWLNQALAQRSETMGVTCRARALNAAALFACYQGDSAETRTYLNESIALCKQANDQLNLAYALLMQAVEAQGHDDLHEARRIAAQSAALFRTAGDQWGLAYVLHVDGLTAYWQGDYAATRALYEESISLFRAVGDRWRLSGPLGRLGDLAYREGDYAKARSVYEESLAILRELNDKSGLASALTPLGDVARACGEYDRAAAYYQDSCTVCQELGDKQGSVWACCGLGQVARQQDQLEQAEAYLQKSLMLLLEVGDSGSIAWVMQSLAYVKHAQGNHRGALLLFQTALPLAREVGHVVTVALCLLGLASTIAGLNQLDRAARLLGAAETLRKEIAAFGSAADRAEYERAMAEACGQIDEVALAAPVAEGRAMTMAEAIEAAMIDL